MKKGCVNQLKRAKQSIKPFVSEIDWASHSPCRDYSSKEFGRAGYVTEIESVEIKAINKARQTEDRKRCLLVARQIEDFHTARSLNISVTELNHGGVYQ